MNCETLTIFDFSDYRKFLQAYQQARQAQDRSFTSSRFCRELGLPNTRGFFADIVKGRRNMSSSYAERFIRVLEMTPHEAQYFRMLVYFDHSTYEQELERLLGVEMSLRPWKHTALFDVLDKRLNLKKHKRFLREKNGDAAR